MRLRTFLKTLLCLPFLRPKAEAKYHGAARATFKAAHNPNVTGYAFRMDPHPLRFEYRDLKWHQIEPQMAPRHQPLWVKESILPRKQDEGRMA